MCTPDCNSICWSNLGQDTIYLDRSFSCFFSDTLDSWDSILIWPWPLRSESFPIYHSFMNPLFGAVCCAAPEASSDNPPDWSLPLHFLADGTSNEQTILRVCMVTSGPVALKTRAALYPFIFKSSDFAWTRSVLPWWWKLIFSFNGASNNSGCIALNNWTVVNHELEMMWNDAYRSLRWLRIPTLVWLSEGNHRRILSSAI